jgi:uncharacterized membrane protein YjjP (DUF1212 family)
MALLGATSAVRFLRFVPAVAATSRADTLNQLYSNLWRGVSLPLAIAVALLGGGVALIAACALFAELAAAVVSVVRLWLRQNVPLQDTAGAAAYVLGFVTIGLGLVLLGTPRWGYWSTAAALLTVGVVSLLVAWLLFPRVARTVRALVAGEGVSKIHLPAPN